MGEAVAAIGEADVIDASESIAADVTTPYGVAGTVALIMEYSHGYSWDDADGIHYVDLAAYRFGEGEACTGL